jgi:acetylornithine deacetylase/succinyl-diaminopimelate desuccinylase-like protein
VLFVLSLCTAPVVAQESAVRAILDAASFKAAAAFIARDHDRFVRELVALTEIPAPPFKEARRAEAFLKMLRESGLQDVEMDQEGNVLGLRKGAGAGLLAVVAHLDTVFPEGTDVSVKRDGHRLMAPGVGDNTRSLALMLAMVRAINAAKLETASDILFVGGVGEEGEGDLRGVKFLLQKGKYKGRVTRFVAIDGGDQQSITRGGVGSRRYRVTFKGPGGHSYGAFGLVNPAFAMGNAMAAISRITVPSSPKTTFNVGVVSGGTSVNSIPYEMQMLVDMRSVSCDELGKLDAEVLSIVRNAADEENAARSTREGRITVDPALIGDRPCGETAENTPIVQTVSSVVRAFGLTPSYGTSSTDANLPMNLGIPAVTIGRGPGGRAHALDEWTTVEPASDARSVEVALGIVLAVANMK